MSTEIPPTALVSWAHRNTDWDDAQAAAWQQTVHDFARLLVDNGVDVDLDLWHQHFSISDWTRWGQNKARDSEFVIVALSEAWRERWQGTNAANVGAGAVQEADTLKGIFGKNQDDFQRKTLLVLLPGATDDVVPEDLYRLNRFYVKELTAAAIEHLLRTIFGRPKYVKPTLGERPDLPAASVTLPETTPLASRPSTPFEAVDRTDYLARLRAVSEARAMDRRRGAGLTDEQVARSISYIPRIPRALDRLEPGEIRVLHGPLGSGKSDVAEQWLQSNIDAASGRAESAVPMWIAGSRSAASPAKSG